MFIFGALYRLIYRAMCAVDDALDVWGDDDDAPAR